MELHQALKQIINTDGQDILTQVRVVNILSDLQAYQKMPAAKYIIASMINDGFMQKLLNIGMWNAKCEQLATQFVQTTGFQEDMVSVIYQSIAYGLSWKNIIDSCVSPSPVPSKPKPTPASPSAKDLMLTYSELKKKKDDFIGDYIEKAINYLNQRIEIKGNWKNTLNISVQAFCSYNLDKLDGYWSNDLTVHVELNGKLKISTIKVGLSIYNHQNEIIRTDYQLISKKQTDFMVLKFDSIHVNIFKYVGNIGRIIVYFEEC